MKKLNVRYLSVFVVYQNKTVIFNHRLWALMFTSLQFVFDKWRVITRNISHAFSLSHQSYLAITILQTLLQLVDMYPNNTPFNRLFSMGFTLFFTTCFRESLYERKTLFVERDGRKYSSHLFLAIYFWPWYAPLIHPSFVSPFSLSTFILCVSLSVSLATCPSFVQWGHSLVLLIPVGGCLSPKILS